MSDPINRTPGPQNQPVGWPPRPTNEGGSMGAGFGLGVAWTIVSGVLWGGLATLINDPTIALGLTFAITVAIGVLLCLRPARARVGYGFFLGALATPALLAIVLAGACFAMFASIG